MSKNVQKRREIRRKLLHKYRPLREYIPGYSSTKLKMQATDLTYKTDSLVRVLNNTNRYLGNVRMVLTGDIQNNDINRDSLFQQFKIDPSSVDLTPSREDSLLRAEVALEDKYNLFERSTSSNKLIFFTPLSGTISQRFDPLKKHYAIDVVAPRETPIKAVADGIVIFAEWTADTGHVIILEHKDGILSVYKHNGSLNKSQGDPVSSGEVIASVGNTGEFTTGPHLHFELWNNGTPVNPTDYIDFK